MSPQTVNAYYNPSYNEIVFSSSHFATASIIIKLNEAVNYGGIEELNRTRNLYGFMIQEPGYKDGNLPGLGGCR
jgi:putative endopeptidase